jgi:hypothetical protein
VDVCDADQSILGECLEIVGRDTLTMYSLREGIDVEARIKGVKLYSHSLVRIMPGEGTQYDDLLV